MLNIFILSNWTLLTRESGFVGQVSVAHFTEEA